MIKACILEKVHSSLFNIFNENNIHTIDVSQMDDNDQLNYIKDAHILIVRSKTINKKIIDAANQLKIIGRAGSGMENVDTKYAQSKGIVCINSPEGNRDAVAEHTIAMLLMLLNQLKKADQEVRNNIWDRKSNWGYEIKDKVFGIIGYGNTGSVLAKKLSGFECKIIVYDKYKKNIKENYLTQVSLNEIYNQSDIVSLHLPLNEETFYYADEKFFDNFSKPVYFINTARGKILKTSALVNALESGKMMGACLDVIEYEDSHFESMSFLDNENFEYLKKSNQVILTPHIAGWTYESYEKTGSILAHKIVKFLKEKNE